MGLGEICLKVLPAPGALALLSWTFELEGPLTWALYCIGLYTIEYSNRKLEENLSRESL